MKAARKIFLESSVWLYFNDFAYFLPLVKLLRGEWFKAQGASDSGLSSDGSQLESREIDILSKYKKESEQWLASHPDFVSSFIPGKRRKQIAKHVLLRSKEIGGYFLQGDIAEPKSKNTLLHWAYRLLQLEKNDSIHHHKLIDIMCMLFDSGSTIYVKNRQGQEACPFSDLSLLSTDWRGIVAQLANFQATSELVEELRGQLFIYCFISEIRLNGNWLSSLRDISILSYLARAFGLRTAEFDTLVYGVILSAASSAFTSPKLDPTLKQHRMDAVKKLISAMGKSEESLDDCHVLHEMKAIVDAKEPAWRNSTLKDRIVTIYDKYTHTQLCCFGQPAKDAMLKWGIEEEQRKIKKLEGEKKELEAGKKELEAEVAASKSIINQVEAKATQAEAKVTQTEAKLEQALARVKELEEKQAIVLPAVKSSAPTIPQIPPASPHHTPAASPGFFSQQQAISPTQTRKTMGPRC